jgi:hypothetical protein
VDCFFFVRKRAAYVIDRVQSKDYGLTYAVPQGSYLEILFLLYASGIFTITSKNLPSSHGFIDDRDSELYLSTAP